jgi:cell division protein ZapA (FtsZ GTPase activity inhibitor)
MDKNQIQVDLLGRSFKIRCEESPEHLRLVLEAFKLRVDQISGKLSITDPLKIAILAGIDLTDEILKLKKNLKIHSEIDSGESSEISLITNTLIERINKSLTE